MTRSFPAEILLPSWRGIRLLFFFPLCLVLLTATEIEGHLPPVHLASLGSRVGLKCPHRFKEYEVAWNWTELAGSRGGDLGVRTTLTFERVQFVDSGRYLCRETVRTDYGRSYVHHLTLLLVVDHACRPNASSGGVDCWIEHVPCSEMGSCLRFLVFSNPLVEDATPLEPTIRAEKEGRLRSEVTIERKKLSSVLMLEFLNSTLIVWPNEKDEPECNSKTKEGLSRDKELESYFPTYLTYALVSCQLVEVCLLTAIIACLCKVYPRMRTASRSTHSFRACTSPCIDGEDRVRVFTQNMKEARSVYEEIHDEMSAALRIKSHYLTVTASAL